MNFMPADFVTETSAVPKEEVSVNLNQGLGLRTYIYVSTVEDKVEQNRDYPLSSTYMHMPTIDDSWASSLQMSIIILVGLCIILIILYATSSCIKLREGSCTTFNST